MKPCSPNCWDRKACNSDVKGWPFPLACCECRMPLFHLNPWPAPFWSDGPPRFLPRDSFPRIHNRASKSPLIVCPQPPAQGFQQDAPSPPHPVKPARLGWASGGRAGIYAGLTQRPPEDSTAVWAWAGVQRWAGWSVSRVRHLPPHLSSAPTAPPAGGGRLAPRPRERDSDARASCPEHAASNLRIPRTRV